MDGTDCRIYRFDDCAVLPCRTGDAGRSASLSSKIKEIKLEAERNTHYVEKWKKLEAALPEILKIGKKVP